MQWSAAERASSPHKNPSVHKFTLDDVVRKRVSGLNMACREAYLGDEDFALFALDRLCFRLEAILCSRILSVFESK